jgi:hypothetical protein
MRNTDIAQLRSELEYLKSLLGQMPDSEVLNKKSLQYRMSQVESELKGLENIWMREPARAIVRFKGDPVVGTHGIFAKFGTEFPRPGEPAGLPWQSSNADQGNEAGASDVAAGDYRAES